MIKPGFKTSEFYVTVGSIIGVLGVGFDAISKTEFIGSHPVVAAVVAAVSAVFAVVASSSYTIGRSMVKTADIAPPAQG